MSTSRAIIFVIAVAISCIGCMGAIANAGDKDPVHQGTIEEALTELNRRVLALPEVVGTAQGFCDGKPCLKVYIIKLSPEIIRNIPDMIDGYPVVAEETGEIRTLPEKRKQ
jgi:hypothetical protein